MPGGPSSGTRPRQRIEPDAYQRSRNGPSADCWPALAKLSAADREVLVLRYLEQLSTADIAGVLGVGEGAVKMRHRRALG